MEDGTHYRTCQSGCAVKLQEGTCQGGTPTCTQKAVCDGCGQPYGELAEHIPAKKYTSENGQHYFKCTTDGCTQVFEAGDCVDKDKNHKCDVCADNMGVHEAAAGAHICDYCGTRATYCSDSDLNKDHICDVCGGEVRVHAAYSDEHVCRYCGGTVSECADNDKDGKCDVCKEPVASEQTGCGAMISGTSVMGMALIGAYALLNKRSSKRRARNR